MPQMSLAGNMVSLAVAAIFLYGPYIWCRYRREPYAKYGLSWHISRRDAVLTAAALVVTLVPLTIVAMQWPGQQLPRFMPLMDVLRFVAVAVAVAVIEETFYRGWAQTILCEKIGVLWGVTITSALFAASHLINFPTPMMLTTFFPGLVMGYLRVKSENIAPSIIYHFCGNVWAIWFFPEFI